MTTSELIGEVGRIYLGETLGLAASGDEAEGTARFILDRLTANQAGAIARAILADPDLAAESSRSNCRPTLWPAKVCRRTL